LYIASVTQQNVTMPIGPSETKVSEQDRAQDGRPREPRNLDDFAVVSHGILQNGSRNLAKFSAENCGPYRSHTINRQITRCRQWPSGTDIVNINELG